MRDVVKLLHIGSGVKKVKIGDWVILGWIKCKGIDGRGAIYKIGNTEINSGPVTTFSSHSIVSENRVVPTSKKFTNRCCGFIWLCLTYWCWNYI